MWRSEALLSQRYYLPPPFSRAKSGDGVFRGASARRVLHIIWRVGEGYMPVEPGEYEYIGESLFAWDFATVEGIMKVASAMADMLTGVENQNFLLAYKTSNSPEHDSPDMWGSTSQSHWQSLRSGTFQTMRGRTFQTSPNTFKMTIMIRILPPAQGTPIVHAYDPAR